MYCIRNKGLQKDLCLKKKNNPVKHFLNDYQWLLKGALPDYTSARAVLLKTEKAV